MTVSAGAWVRTRSGFLDTCGYFGGVMEEYFDAVAGARRKYRERLEAFSRAAATDSH